MKYIIIVGYRHAGTSHATGCLDACHALGVYTSELRKRKEAIEQGDSLPRSVCCYEVMSGHYLCETKIENVALEAQKEIDALLVEANMPATRKPENEEVKRLRESIDGAMKELHSEFDGLTAEFSCDAIQKAHDILYSAINTSNA